MGNDLCFLITVLNTSAMELVLCALKLDANTLPKDMDIAECPMEQENREYLHGLLDEHIRNCGPIVYVSELFGVKDLT